MTQFSVSYEGDETIVDVQKILAPGCDQLDRIMIAVGDALSAAGFDDDVRLVQMKDYWAELNSDFYNPAVADEDIGEGYPGLYASQDTVAEESMPTIPFGGFQKGDVVKVVRGDVVDDHEVLGDVGVIESFEPIFKDQPIYLKFTAGKKPYWYTSPRDLELLYRPE